MNLKLPYRPVLKLSKTKLEKIMDVVGMGVFVCSILFLLLNWANIPSEVPSHFNGQGEVDRWGSKIELIILPIIGTFLLVLMTLLEKVPHVHNYPDRLNESNVEQFYKQSRMLLNGIKNICLLLFSFLIIQITRVSLGEIQSFGLWFLPIFLVVFLSMIIFGLYKQSKIK